MCNCSLTLCFTGITKYQTAKLLAERLPGKITEEYLEGYAYVVLDNKNRKWYIGTDNNISPLRKVNDTYEAASERYRVSVKTPMMSYYDISYLFYMNAVFENSGAIIQERSLMSIEADIRHYGSREMIAMLNFINTYSSIICSFFGIRLNSLYYINFYSRELVQHMNNANIRTITEFYDELYRMTPTKPRDLFVSYSSQSYQESLMAYSPEPFNTVIFRFFKMHFDSDHIQAYFKLVETMVDYVYHHVDDEVFRPGCSPDKFRYTEWFEKIGFSGSICDLKRYTIIQDYIKNHDFTGDV